METKTSHWISSSKKVLFCFSRLKFLTLSCSNCLLPLAIINACVYGNFHKVCCIRTHRMMHWHLNDFSRAQKLRTRNIAQFFSQNTSCLGRDGHFKFYLNFTKTRIYGLSKDIEFSQFGIFRIFLPLRFDVKWKWAILGGQKLQFWTFRRALILIVKQNCIFENV